MSLVVEEQALPEAREFDGCVFPLTLGPKDLCTVEQLCAYLKANRERTAAQLLLHGAILFRGFPVETPEHFAAVVQEGLGMENLPYMGGAAVRTNVVRDVVFTSNESPPSEPIPWHHEMAQTANPPSHILFYCHVPAKEGGATPIVRSDVVMSQLQAAHPKFVESIADGIHYQRVMPEDDDATSAIGRGWKNTFLSKTREEAEANMRAVGTTWEWQPNGDLSTKTKLLPAVKIDRRGPKQRPVFFNQIVAVFEGWNDSRNNGARALTDSRGQHLDPDAVAFASRALDDASVAFKWHKGDVILIDNLTVMHSRQTFVPPRRTLASICKSMPYAAQPE